MQMLCPIFIPAIWGYQLLVSVIYFLGMMEIFTVAKLKPGQQRLVHVNVSLPEGLLAFVRRQAELENRSFSGQVRHLFDAARRANGVDHSPPKSPWPVLPNVQGNAEPIAEARGLIEQFRKERARIEQRRRRLNGSAADDSRDRELFAWIDIIEGRIAIAERMKPTNRADANG
jgi:hypothetical protein